MCTWKCVTQKKKEHRRTAFPPQLIFKCLSFVFSDFVMSLFSEKNSLSSWVRSDYSRSIGKGQAKGQAMEAENQHLVIFFAEHPTQLISAVRKSRAFEVFNNAFVKHIRTNNVNVNIYQTIVAIWLSRICRNINPISMRTLHNMCNLSCVFTGAQR